MHGIRTTKPLLTTKQQELLATFEQARIAFIKAGAFGEAYVAHYQELAACLDAGFNPYSHLQP